MKLKKWVFGVVLLSVTFAAGASPRILFSHYAPDEGPLFLAVNDQPLTPALQFGSTDTQYRLFVAEPQTFTVKDADGEVLASLDTALTRNDFSLIAYNDAAGDLQLRLLTDDVRSRDDSSIQNTVIRTGTFAKLSTGFTFGFESRTDLVVDGVDSFGVVFNSIGNDVRVLDPDILGTGVDPDGSSRALTVSLRLGTLGEAVGDFEQVIFSFEGAVEMGTTDLFVIGNGQRFPYQVVERARPGNRSSVESGLYGELAIVGSGTQVVELAEDGRVYGLFYSYDEAGEPQWFYFDSSCDGLPEDEDFRMLACSDPEQILVSDNVYSISFYRATGGALTPGVGASLDAVGFGRLRLRTLLDDAELRQSSSATMRVRLGDLEEILATGAPTPGGVRFVFQQLPGG